MALTDNAEFQDKCPIFIEVQWLPQLLGLWVPLYPPPCPITNSLTILKEMAMPLALSPDTHTGSLEGLDRRSWSSCTPGLPAPVFQAASASGLRSQLMSAVRAGPAGAAASSITKPWEDLGGVVTGRPVCIDLFPPRALGTGTRGEESWGGGWPRMSSFSFL